jgi:hypothetical protein
MFSKRKATKLLVALSLWRYTASLCRQGAAYNPNHRIAIDVNDRRQKSGRKAALAARKSRKRKRAREGAREPLKVRRTLERCIVGQMPNAVNLSPPAIIKILCERCRKTTNSKAVGEPPSPQIPRCKSVPLSPTKCGSDRLRI